jgi:hypothetical protein
LFFFFLLLLPLPLSTETQLGQNYETVVEKAKSALVTAVMGKARASGGGKKTTVSVVDPGSHWPRLWRVSLTQEELARHKSLDKNERKKEEPSNENPMPKGLSPRLRELFTKLDKQRVSDLSLPSEGIGFVTHEVHCTHRNEFR